MIELYNDWADKDSRQSILEDPEFLKTRSMLIVQRQVQQLNEREQVIKQMAHEYVLSCLSNNIGGNISSENALKLATEIYDAKIPEPKNQ